MLLQFFCISSINGGQMLKVERRRMLEPRSAVYKANIRITQGSCPPSFGSAGLFKVVPVNFVEYGIDTAVTEKAQ